MSTLEEQAAYAELQKRRGEDKKTPQRHIRIPDDPYYPAVARAKREGLNIGEVTRELLDLYAQGEIDI